MKIIHSVTTYVTVLVVFIAVLLTAALIGLILFKRRKKNLLNEEDSPEKKLYANALDLVKIDDIKDNMIISEGKKSFIAVLKCRGGDFLRSDLDEQVRTEYAYVNFWLAQDSPITYRQYGEDIDLEYTIGRYEKAREKLESDLFNAEEDRKALKTRLEKHREDNPAEAARLAVEIRKLQKAINAYEWRIEHLDDQIRHMLNISGPSAGRQRSNQTYVISWAPEAGLINPLMTEEEVYEKAVQELDSMCRDKMRLLSDAGAVAIRCSTSELIDMCRRYFRPYSGNRFTTEEINNTSFFDDITTSGSYARKSRRAIIERGEKFIFGGRG
ncbi:MAG: hypothetical protein IJT00_04305 [Lachnospiraceae bacterium]|nr:hypothetical protein [Lachnospiraceae bacterium]